MKRLRSTFATLAFAVAGGLLTAGPALADFGVASFDGGAFGPGGTTVSQAGAYPVELTTEIDLATRPDPAFGEMPAEPLKSIEVDLPVGMVGNQANSPACTQQELAFEACSPQTQVGVVGIELLGGFGFGLPVFNIESRDGVAAQFGFLLLNNTVVFEAKVRRGDSGITAVTRGISQTTTIFGIKLVLWGVPADPSHDPLRGTNLACSAGEPSGYLDPANCEGGGAAAGVPRRPYLAMPTACTGTPLVTRLRADSWADPGDFKSASFVSHVAGDPSQPVAVDGCEKVPFAPTANVTPTTTAASAPTGLDFSLRLAQPNGPDGLRSSDLRDVNVTLPPGMAINPPSAEGLVSCGDEQLGIGSDAPLACPPASKIGTATATTPLLEDRFEGGVYLRPQASDDPASGQMFRLALVLANEQRGISIRLPGEIRADPASGQLVTSFRDNPQLPISALDMHLKSGPGAPLVNPAGCGEKPVRIELAAWSGQRVELAGGFSVDCGPGAGSFTPGFEAGTLNPVAGAASPFTLRVTREDGQPNISRIDTTLPEGLLAKLAGVPLCGDAAAASGNCPQATQVGTTTVGVGAGSNPLFVPQQGKTSTAVYLAAPYKGAPYSLVVKVPAQAGPFDLGTVAVRSAISVDPTNAQVSVKSDPLPQILRGIPIAYRDVRVDVNRPDFTLNPTSCDPMTVNGVIASAGGKSANVSDRFQVGSCERLAFKPKLSLKLKGGTKRGTYPALKAVLRAKPGQANIGRVSVALPHSAFLAQEHIRTVCTRVQFAAEACPAGSVYGYATATTPLLDQPLQGPVYLRSSSNPLPDLVAALDGQIEIDLVGRIDSVNGGIRTTFDSVPDAPVSRFVLSMKGGKKGLLVNSRDLCKGTNRAKVLIDGQNGKAADQSPVLKNSCGKNSRRR